ncbi:transposase, partial [Vagococcus fluvialis]|uniref:transposase n=1 Tax=Vagococcus fluvialis TaxID=2738 RepID=UPI003B5C0A36
NAIELYLTSKKSYQETANTLGMNNSSLIANWLRQFKEEGIDGLSRMKGRPTKMSKNKSKDLSQSDKDKIKELEAQLLTLRIENAYLKELRKLREQEEKQRMKLSRPSYLASEENSN